MSALSYFNYLDGRVFIYRVNFFFMVLWYFYAKSDLISPIYCFL